MLESENPKPLRLQNHSCVGRLFGGGLHLIYSLRTHLSFYLLFYFSANYHRKTLFISTEHPRYLLGWQGRVLSFRKKKKKISLWCQTTTCDIGLARLLGCHVAPGSTASSRKMQETVGDCGWCRRPRWHAEATGRHATAAPWSRWSSVGQHRAHPQCLASQGLCQSSELGSLDLIDIVTYVVPFR